MICFSRSNHSSTNLKKILSWKLDKFTLFTHSLGGWENFPKPSRFYIRLCNHGKRFLLLKWGRPTYDIFPKANYWILPKQWWASRLLACSRRYDSGVWHEDTPPYPVAVFPAHLCLRHSHNLHAWNRIDDSMYASTSKQHTKSAQAERSYLNRQNAWKLRWVYLYHFPQTLHIRCTCV